MAVKANKPQADLASVRETVESVWVAIVLAFVLRGFLIEAFVIPTGSMAPRLMGEHWTLQCPQCGWEYSYGVHRQFVESADYSRSRLSTPTEARCPNCRFPFEYNQMPARPNSGDRVLVLKYLYQFSEPQPWDVIVFKNPQDGQQNYIKRLIGLPGETIEIVHGDVFVSPSPQGPFQVRTKPPRAQEAMWQMVFDNDYAAAKGWRARGLDPVWSTRGREARWALDGLGGRSFRFQGGSREEIFLEAQREVFLPHYGYNSPLREARAMDQNRDICTDLKLSFTFRPASPDCAVGMRLGSFEHEFRGVVRADGEAVLYYRPGPTGQWLEWGRTRVGALEVGRWHALALVHVDLGVELHVAGRKVLQRRGSGYPEDYATLKERARTEAARELPAPPVAIDAEGGGCELRHVRLLRDVYYTSPLLEDSLDRDRAEYDYARSQDIWGRYAPGRRGGWGTTGYPITLDRHPDDPDLDEFFVLGDNSPQSLDSRLWLAAAPSLRLYDEQKRPLYKLGTVPRYNLIGRALFVYWPAGYRVPGLPGLPAIPNVGRMRLIR